MRLQLAGTFRVLNTDNICRPMPSRRGPIMKRILLLAAILSIIMSLGSAQESHDMSAIPANSMEDHHMDMGPHMKMTELRDLKPGDEQRAAQVVDAARQAATKYQDYHAAIADGYEIFLPNLPQKMYPLHQEVLRLRGCRGFPSGAPNFASLRNRVTITNLSA